MINWQKSNNKDANDLMIGGKVDTMRGGKSVDDNIADTAKKEKQDRTVRKTVIGIIWHCKWYIIQFVEITMKINQKRDLVLDR